MMPIGAPEFQGWKLIGEAPLPEETLSFYRKRAESELKESRMWGLASVAGIAILACGPWLIFKSIGTQWIYPLTTFLVVLLLFIWLPIYMWREQRSLADSFRTLLEGGYWVYEPLSREALELFRAQLKQEVAEGFEPEGSGQRYVLKGSNPRLLPETREKIRALAIPTIGISHSEKAGFSRFGGNPLAPPGFEWPTADGVALAFLAQIDLSQIKDARLPSSGYLYFFEHFATVGRVLYCQGNTGSLTEVVPPVKPYHVYQPLPIQFDSAYIYPDADAPEVQALNLPQDQLNAYGDFQIGAWPHRLFGLPDPVQPADMAAECHAACSGFSRSPAEWKLLLQLSEDEDADFNWGDAGKLYFWIREEDLAQENFDRVQMFAEFL